MNGGSTVTNAPQPPHCVFDRRVRSTLRLFEIRPARVLESRPASLADWGACPARDPIKHHRNGPGRP